jgi:hypothetical protein
MVGIEAPTEIKCIAKGAYVMYVIAEYKSRKFRPAALGGFSSFSFYYLLLLIFPASFLKLLQANRDRRLAITCAFESAQRKVHDASKISG